MNKNKISKVILLSVLSFTAFHSSAEIKDIDFPYGKFKEVDFENKYINKIFEDFISKIQKKDNQYNTMIEEYNTLYLSKLTKENQRGQYRKKEDQDIIIYDLNFKEMDNFNKVTKLFYIDELSIFNDFIKEIKSNQFITSNEKKVMLDSIKSLHKSYQNFSFNYKHYNEYYQSTCSIKESERSESLFYDYNNEYCSDLYNKFNKEFSLNLKSFTVYGMNDLVNGYLSNVNSGDFKKDLQMKIDAIKRNSNFNYKD